jgi:hypothetical protein
MRVVERQDHRLAPAGHHAVARDVVVGYRDHPFLVHARLRAFLFYGTTHFPLDQFSHDDRFTRVLTACKRRHATRDRSSGVLFAKLCSEDIAPRSSIVAQYEAPKMRVLY